MLFVLLIFEKLFLYIFAFNILYSIWYKFNRKIVECNYTIVNIFYLKDPVEKKAY